MGWDWISEALSVEHVFDTWWMGVEKRSKSMWQQGGWMMNHGTPFKVLLHNCNCIAIANVGIFLTQCKHNCNAPNPALFQIATTPCLNLSKSPNALYGYVATV